jgi:DNA-binding transcriptional regulator YiaG
MTPTQLKDWRERLALTQGQAATVLGCGRRSLQQWESGQHLVPKYILLACRYLELTDDY